MDVIDVKEELKKFKVNFIYFYPCLEKSNPTKEIDLKIDFFDKLLKKEKGKIRWVKLKSTK